jgi:hypothetical protein
MSILLSLSASNTKGNTKRAIVNAMFFIGYCAGCIGSPQLWTERPRYFKGVVTAIVTWCLLILCVIGYWYLCWKDNARRDTKKESDGADVHTSCVLDKNGDPAIDITDKEDTAFRYSY